ncbi:hypothetical protein GCM10011609_52790 [Lentzea pudingi]|uniref:Uncharacterized protein n=1 Tax=Lentzea pudingi TaxID=1789439 RepID=A0ABQ2IDI8_9PSEU|nr:hypothetical protein GCM10011609_52790 [Lentzea pudingi]
MATGITTDAMKPNAYATTYNAAITTTKRQLTAALTRSSFGTRPLISDSGVLMCLTLTVRTLAKPELHQG